MLISFLVGIAIEAVTLKNLSGVLQHVELTPSQCRVLYDELGRLDWERYFRRALQTEGCEGLWCFETVNRDPRQGWEILVASEPSGGSPPRPKSVLEAGGRALIGLYLSPPGKVLRLNDEVAYCDQLERALKLMDKPFPEGPAACGKNDENVPWYHLMSRWIVVGGRSAMACYRAIGYRNAMQVALALKAYRAKRGQYPGSLAALSAYPGWKLPLDPFSGKPFVYHRKGAGFVLYSWSEDLDDDGGRPFAYFGLNGDWVWEFKR